MSVSADDAFIHAGFLKIIMVVRITVIQSAPSGYVK